MRRDSNALSSSEKDGLSSFLVTGCAKCHFGAMFSDYKLHTLATHMDVNFKNISRIVEFLNTLNDDSFDKTIPTSVPSGLRVMRL